MGRGQAFLWTLGRGIRGHPVLSWCLDIAEHHGAMGTWLKDSRAPPTGVQFAGLGLAPVYIHNKPWGDSETHSSIETSSQPFWTLPFLEGGPMPLRDGGGVPDYQAAE